MASVPQPLALPVFTLHTMTHAAFSQPETITWHCSTEYTEIQADVGSIYLLDKRYFGIICTRGGNSFKTLSSCSSLLVSASHYHITNTSRTVHLFKLASLCFWNDIVRWYCVASLSYILMLPSHLRPLEAVDDPPPSFPRANKSHSPAR